MNDIDPARPRWRTGLRSGLIALFAVLTVEMMCLQAWLDGALAAGALEAGAARSASSSLILFPGSRAYVERFDGGGGYGMHPGWAGLAVGLVVFVAVARPWRLLARSRV